MKAVFKYTLEFVDEFELLLPKDAHILSFGEQMGRPQLWVLVDPSSKDIETRRFRMAGTGHPINQPGRLRYLGTASFRTGALIFHLFEIL